MTVHELHQLATRRRRALRIAQGRTFTTTKLHRWLDQQVDAGLLTKHRHRYYLTQKGRVVAWALGGTP